MHILCKSVTWVIWRTFLGLDWLAKSLWTVILCKRLFKHTSFVFHTPFQIDMRMRKQNSSFLANYCTWKKDGFDVQGPSKNATSYISHKANVLADTLDMPCMTFYQLELVTPESQLIRWYIVYSDIGLQWYFKGFIWCGQVWTVVTPTLWSLYRKPEEREWMRERYMCDMWETGLMSCWVARSE